MAHKEQVDYLERLKNKIPEALKDCKVLDIGSIDVNGNEESFFDNCDFIGLDSPFSIIEFFMDFLIVVLYNWGLQYLK